MPMKVILVSGIPASGKTTIARFLSKKSAIQLHTKYQEKEKLFSSENKSTYLRWGWYEKHANEMLFSQLQKHVESNQDVIIESNFIPLKDRKKIKQIVGHNEIIEVYCTAKGSVILKRFIQRNEAKVRTKHKSNHDRLWYPAMSMFCFLKLLKIDFPHNKVAINDTILSVDTTDFKRVDFEKIHNFISYKQYS